MSLLFCAVLAIGDVWHKLMQTPTIYNEFQLQPLWDDFCCDIARAAHSHPGELVLVIIHDGDDKDMFLGVLSSKDLQGYGFLPVVRYAQSKNFLAYPVFAGEGPIDFEYALRNAMRCQRQEESFQIIIGNAAVERWFRKGEGRFTPFLYTDMFAGVGYALYPGRTHPLL